MLFALLITVTGGVLASVFAAHRHAEAKAWDRELAVAFCVDQRKEMAARRIL